MRNIEIKAVAKDSQLLEELLTQVAVGVSPLLLEQEDTFFPIPNGRLKLRIVDNSVVYNLRFLREFP